MKEITISVHNSEFKLFRSICSVCNCHIFNIKQSTGGFSSVLVGSLSSVNLYQLGFEFGAYAPTFISN